MLGRLLLAACLKVTIARDGGKVSAMLAGQRRHAECIDAAVQVTLEPIRFRN